MIEPSIVVQRLDQLRAEIAEAERALRDLDARREHVLATLLRLSGAAEALDEIVATAREPAATAAP